MEPARSASRLCWRAGPAGLKRPITWAARLALRLIILPDVKRTKKTPEQTKQLQLDTTTVKVLTDKDFELVNGGNGAKSAFCGGPAGCH
jgi:hypothetical protein